MTTWKWLLLAAWILSSYLLSFIVVVVLDDRNLVPPSWIRFLELVYAPVIWLYENSSVFKAITDGIVNLSHER